MLFDSTAYIVFLAIVTLIYWRVPFRAQNYLLLGASYFFYGWWDWRFLSLMAVSTVVDFVVARQIDAADNPVSRRLLLTTSLVLNFGFLAFFKYFGFFVDTFVELAAVLGLRHIPVAVWQILLPPAISFYTFQEVAYIVDVYHRRLKPAGSLIDYALFVSLFPHLIAGPIQRPSHLLPQVQQPRTFEADKFFDGLMLILEGLFRKVVIADNCALVANAALAGQLGGSNGVSTLIGTYAFAWQIYGDFSGYSCIARGSAQLMGFHFMVNFRQPYFAQSLQDFWRRWHISLSSWLRDYLYFPLGGNRRGRLRTYFNLMATMLLGGLWHGANWTFVVWGGIHGVGLAIERFVGGTEIRNSPSAIGRWMRRALIFHVVCFSWVFFRLPSFTDAMASLAALSTWTWNPVYAPALIFLGAHILLLLLVDLQLEASSSEYVLEAKPFAFRIATGLVLCCLITLFGANQASAFIYFQF